MELWLIISGVILSISIILLAMLLIPEKSKPPPRRQIKKTAPPPQLPKPPEPQAPKKNHQEMVAKEKIKRIREQTRKWVDENPKIAVRMIRFWLHQGKLQPGKKRL